MKTKISYKDWKIEALTGYKPITSFYMDFSIADRFGINAIKDTFNRAFEAWHNNYKYLTELVMALNWKCWEHYDHDDQKSVLYRELYERTNTFALDNLEGKELSYFIRTTD